MKIKPLDISYIWSSIRFKTYDVLIDEILDDMDFRIMFNGINIGSLYNDDGTFNLDNDHFYSCELYSESGDGVYLDTVFYGNTDGMLRSIHDHFKEITRIHNRFFSILKRYGLSCMYGLSFNEYDGNYVLRSSNSLAMIADKLCHVLLDNEDIINVSSIKKEDIRRALDELKVDMEH